MKVVWITWEKQRRNAGISAAIDAELFELLSSKKFIWRYLELSKLTMDIIFRKKPDIVIAQNPSIVLAVIVVFMKSFLNYKSVIDAHNSGIFPMEGKSFFLNLTANYLQRNADLTIITNHNLLQHVIGNGGNGFVLPDKIPKTDLQKNHSEGFKKIVFICTFSSDEPYLAVIEAARYLPIEYKVYITGNNQGKLKADIIIPEQVELTGYLPENEYWNLLCCADVIMDLTTRENCLVCGAYEGLSLEKPIILSNTEANKHFFDSGCVYVDSNMKSICDGILGCFGNIEKNRRNVKLLKNRLEQCWDVQIKDLLTHLKDIG